MGRGRSSHQYDPCHRRNKTPGCSTSDDHKKRSNWKNYSIYNYSYCRTTTPARYTIQELRGTTATTVQDQQGLTTATTIVTNIHKLYNMKPVILCIAFLLTQTAASLLDGLEHHHGEHGEHHDEHGEHHDEHGEHHDEHSEHHGEHDGEHDHEEWHDGAEPGGDHPRVENDGTHDQPNTEDVPAHQDSVASASTSDLGGSFLNIPGANPTPAADPTLTYDLAPAPTDAVDNTIRNSQDYDYETSTSTLPSETPSFSSSGDAKQLDSGDAGLGSTVGYPQYAAVPLTSFTCDSQQYGGYYADPEAQCQVFHICHNGRKMGSFLCPNRTLFNQEYFVCDWWYNVDCNAATQSYALNANIGVVPDTNN
ncbi:uncharacterized protein [Panulirus ornatus]|uniref:uncharacterized protein n=1 Tax=Panulirus ornatus TaxID=150431 RepID=UPI003A881EBD